MTVKFEFYKIYDPATGLFSSGGSMPKFSKRGKTWQNIGHVKSHVSLVSPSKMVHYTACELHKYTPEGTEATPMLDFLRETLRNYYSKKRYFSLLDHEIADILGLQIEST